MIHSSIINEFKVIQTNDEGLDFNRLVDEFSELFVGKLAAVLAFDGDSLKPTTSEYNRGWKYDHNEIAYSPVLTLGELGQNIFANCYDEWYLFDEEFIMPNNNIFVTYSGFRLINIESSDMMKSLAASFWDRIKTTCPTSFILNGDNFIYGSKNRNEVNRILASWS